MKATKETQRKEVQGGYLLLERKVRVNANGVKQANPGALYLIAGLDIKQTNNCDYEDLRIFFKRRHSIKKGKMQQHKGG